MASLWIPPFDRSGRLDRRSGVLRRTIPRMAAVAIALMLLTAAGPFAGGGIAAGQEQASSPPGIGPRLELHAWLCPAGIARADFDVAADCTAPVPGATFTSPPIGAGFPPEGRDFIETQTTGDDGAATWDPLFDDDAFTLEEDGAALTGLDLASVDYVAPCAVEGDEDILLLALEDFSLASVIVPPVEGIGNDRAILCDWYLPPGASAGT